MNLTLAILCCCAMPFAERVGIACDEVEVVEVNHYYDDEGQHIFDQLIFYSRGEQRPFDVRAWRLLKSATQFPTRNFNTGRYDVIWHDGEVTRRVEARVYRETFTQYDPEMRERSHLEKHLRTGLLQVRDLPDAK